MRQPWVEAGPDAPELAAGDVTTLLVAALVALALCHLLVEWWGEGENGGGP